MPALPRRLAARAPLLLAAAVALPSCARGAAARPTAPADPRADDVGALPAFDDAEPAAPQTDGEAAAVPYERFHVLLGDAPARGPADAPVTIVMFSDFECPFCRRGQETMHRLVARYPGKIRLVYKAFPLDFHENAFVAALAARSAQAQGKFWPFHDAMYALDELSAERVLGVAQQVGLDLDRLRRDLDQMAGLTSVARDMRQARRLGVSSTPSFFVNGRFVKGAQPYEDFAHMVEQELELARSWRAAGVADDEIYAHAIRDGYRRVDYRGRSELDPDGVYPVPVGDSPTRGPATAPVTIVAFGDFQCPFCARGFDTLEKVRARYGDKVRMVYKHLPLPFHSHALLAARASVAADAQGKFWPFHDALYARHAKFDEAGIRAVARKAGLDMRAFDRAMADTKIDQQVARDMDLARKLGIRGTPAYFVNGRPILGAQPEVQFILVIEEELQRAAALTREGVAPADLYRELTSRPLD